MTVDQSLSQVLQRLGVKLPPRPEPVGSYRPAVISGGWVYFSGQISRDAEGKVMVGKVGKELTPEAGKRAAQLAALQAISLIHSEVGFEKVEQVVRIVGFVQSEGGFYGQSDVMNAASEVFMEIFGEKGRHARTAVGVSCLPFNAAVELELTVKLR